MSNRTARVTILSLIVLALSLLPVSASVDPAVVSESSSSLVKLGIMSGDDKGNLKLQDKIKRCEFITLVVRMLGMDRETDVSDITLDYKDISSKHWAYNYMKIAVKRGLITGYSDNTVKPDGYITLAEAEFILIRALGYESTLSGEWPEKVVTRSKELNLNTNLDLPPEKQLIRGEASVLIFNSLSIDFKQ